MPANPERQRPTPLLKAEVGARAGLIILEELKVVTDEVSSNPKHPIKKETVIAFFHNNLGAPRVQRPT